MTGGCLCGGMRYEISGPIGRASHCYCSMCRKAHGAAFATYARVLCKDFHWTSDRDLMGEYASSSSVTRVFCKRCGSPLLWVHVEANERVAVAMGSMDLDPGLRPTLQLHLEDKAAWDMSHIDQEP